MKIVLTMKCDETY